MSKSEDFLLFVAGIIGLAALFKKLQEQQNQLQPTYQCPQCRNPIQRGAIYCPNCFTSLKWI